MSKQRLRPLLVSEQNAARLLDYEVRKFQLMNECGQCPRPIRHLGKPRWSVRELSAWVDAGCPRVEEWEERKRLRKLRATG